MPHGLAQLRIEKVLDAQAELDRLVAKYLAASMLALRLSMPAHCRVKPDEQGATFSERFIICLPIRGAVLLRTRFHTIRLPDPGVLRWRSLIYATKPSRA